MVALYGASVRLCLRCAVERVRLTIPRNLRPLLSKFTSLAARTVPWLIVGGFGLGAAYLLLAATEWIWGPHTCITMERKEIRDLSGFDFEISETINCDVSINVLVSKVGQTKKTLVFKFSPPDHDAIPSITSLDAGTVRISVGRVPFIFCRKNKWETLTVKYDIGVVDYAGRDAPDEC